MYAGQGRGGRQQFRGARRSRYPQSNYEYSASASRTPPLGDGDFAMDEGPVSGSYGASNHENAPVELQITGHTGASQQSFIDFLRRKCEKPFTTTAIRNENDVLFLTVQHWGQAMALKKLSGIRFAGGKVQIQLVVNSSSGSSLRNVHNGGSAIETLKTFLRTRYNESQKYLNLENMGIDENLKSVGIPSLGDPRAPSSTGPVLLKLISQEYPNVESISFAKNNLRSLFPLSTISKSIPNIVNLSLADNNINSFRELDQLHGHDLPKLRELVLTGNPLRQLSLKRSGDETAYKSEISRKFPSLQVLDQETISKIKFDIPENANNVLPSDMVTKSIKGGFIDSDMTKAPVLDFLSRYFQIYDSDRRGLLDLYDSDAIFSIALDITVNKETYNSRRSRFSASSRSERDFSTVDPTREFSGYMNFRRNLLRDKDLQRRMNTLHIGNLSIAHVFSQLPLTRHETTRPEKICVDAWQVIGLVTQNASTGSGLSIQSSVDPTSGAFLFISLHGEFIEANGPGREVKRFFERTFIILPAKPGSKAALAGWPYVITNDTLVIRSQKGSNEERPWNINSSCPTDQSTTPSPPCPTGMTQVQYSQVLELSRITGLNFQFSTQCLAENQWDPATALQVFQQAKEANRIPPEAFVK